MGFIDEFREELPMEYAVELNKLLKKVRLRRKLIISEKRKLGTF